MSVTLSCVQKKRLQKGDRLLMFEEPNPLVGQRHKSQQNYASYDTKILMPKLPQVRITARERLMGYDVPSRYV